MKRINASEIGSYLYCRRAWWYQQQGLPPDNMQDLAAGIQAHTTHGRKIRQSHVLRILGWVTPAAAGILLVVWLLLSIL